MKNDDQSYREERRNDNKIGKLLTGLAVLAIMVGIGKYIIDRNNESVRTGESRNILGLQIDQTPTPEATGFQTITLAMSSEQLTNWIQQIIDQGWQVKNLQAAIQGSQVVISGQSTSSLAPGSFVANIQPTNRSENLIAVTKVTREGEDVPAATLALINSATNTAFRSYLGKNNLTVSNIEVNDNQVLLDIMGPTEKLNQIMSGQVIPSATPEVAF